MSRLIWGSSVPSKPEEGPKQSRLAQFFPSSAATTTSSALPLDGDGPIRNDEAFVSGDANRLNRSGPSGGSGQGGGGGRRGGNGGGGGDARPRGITFMDGEVAPAVFDNSPYSRAFVSAWRGHREDAMGQQQQQPPQQHQQANVMLPAGGGGGGAFGGAPSGASGGGSTLFAFAGYPTIGGASSVPRTASTPTAADLPPFVVRPRGSRSSAAVSVAAPSSSSHPFPPSSHVIGHSVSGGVASESMARPTAMAMGSLPTASGCASSRASSGAAGMRSPSPFAPAPADCLLSNGGGPSAIATSTVSTNSGSVSLASAFTAAYMLGLVSPSPSNGIGGGAGRPLSGSVVPPPQASAPPQAAASRGGGGGNAYAAVTDFDFLLLTPYLPEQGPQPSSGTASLPSSGPLHVSENGLVGDRPAVRSSSQGPSPRRRVLGRIMFEASMESEGNGGVGGETGNKGCKGAGMGGTISEAAGNSNGKESGSEGEDELLPADGEGPVTDFSGGGAVAVVTHPSSDAADEAAVMDEVQLLTPAAAAEVSTLFIDPSRYPRLRMLPAIPFGLTLDGGNNGRVVAGGVHQLQQQHSAAAASGPITLPTAATPLPLPASHPLPTPIPPQWRGIFANCVFFLNSCDADRLVSLYVLEKLIRFMGGVTVMGLSTRTVTFVVSQHLSSTKEQRVKPQAARVSFGGGGGSGKEKEVVAPAAGAGAVAPTPSELARRPPPLTVRLLDTNALAASSSVKGGGGMGGGVGGGAYASSSSASLRLAAKRLADAERYVHPHFILACAKMGRRVPSAPFRTMVAPPPSSSSLHPARGFFSAVVPPSAAAAAIEATAGPLEGPLVFDSVAAIVPYYARCAADAAARKRRGGGGGVAHGRFPAAPEVSSAAFPQRGPSLVGAVTARSCATHGVASVAGQKRPREGTAEGIIDLSPDGGYI